MVKLRLVEGNGVVDPDTDMPAPFDEALARLDALLMLRAIDARDLKARFAGFALKPEASDLCLELRVGPTYYRECVLGIEHPEDARHLAELGRVRHGDPRRYLGCGLGVVLLLTTMEGDVLLGVRNGSTYQGRLHGVSGWLPFERDVSSIDPIAHALTECEEEIGLTEVEKPELLGMVSYGFAYETDLLFTANVSTSALNDLVERRHWTDAVDAREHSELILAPPEQFLSKEATDHRSFFVPSSLFGLRALVARRRAAGGAHELPSPALRP